MKDKLPIIILLVLAFLTRFFFLDYPAQVVFDEVHFGKFVASYFTHEYYFDIHPPLGKLLIAEFAKISGLNLDFDFAKIGETFDAYQLFILRFLPALFGALFIPLIYKLLLAIGASRKGAFLGGWLALFDNAFLVESKFILTDAFLLFFGFLSLYLFFVSRKFHGKKRAAFLIFTALTSGLALSVKWTGLSFSALIISFLFYDYLSQRKIKKLLAIIAIFILIVFFVYLSIFAAHFKLLQKPGTGAAFMSASFSDLPFLQKFWELNQKMYFYSSTLKISHPDSSYWYQWPLMIKPVWYWTDSSLNADFKSANIYFLGNPFVWWLVAAGLPVIWLVLLFRKQAKSPALVIYSLSFGYFINLLAFAFISRVTFLYHYLISLTFGILILSLAFDKYVFFYEKKETKPYLLAKNKLKQSGFFSFSSAAYFLSYLALLLLPALGFLVFLPLAYGIPISKEILNWYGFFL